MIAETGSAALQTEKLVRERLQVLLGLPLSIARNAANMKVLHFGAIRPNPSGRGTVGTYAMHIQCPWRIVNDQGIVTGHYDIFEPPRDDAEIDEDDQRAGNLQRVRISDLLKGYDEATRSPVNTTGDLMVQAVTASPYGDVDIRLSGGYCLQILPVGSKTEDWRFFEIGGPHFIVSGGRVEVS